MTARNGKRIAAAGAVAALAIAGWFLWQGHEESLAKAAVSAEIRAARAARKRPPEVIPTVDELVTAEKYRIAASRLTVVPFIAGEFEGAWEAMEAVPWSIVPEPIARMLEANAEGLALVDAADARETCRFPDRTLQEQHSRCTMLLRVLTARGHAALARGEPLAAAEDVGRLVRVGRDLGAVPSEAGADDFIPWHLMHLQKAEQEAAGLLSALATAPGLPPEAGPALADAARARWGTAEASRRTIDFLEDHEDAYLLVLLSPEAGEFLAKMDAMGAEVEGMWRVGEQTLREKVEDRVRKAFTPGTGVPPAGTVRWLFTTRAPIVAAMRRRDTVALAPGGPHDKVGALFGLLGPMAFRRALANEARVAVARAGAAIRAYELREGAPPKELSDLVPAVLAEVPLDPFDGGPLAYETDGTAWRVASRMWRKVGYSAAEEEEDPPIEVRFPRAAK